MSGYNYQEIKPVLFTEQNQRLFIGIRDHAFKMLETSGAFSMGKAMILPKGVGAAGSWEMMACVDRLVELGEIIEVPTAGWGQDRIFTKRRVD